MPKCTYCGKDYESFKGVLIVDSLTGALRYYCSSKCRKNAIMKRKKRKWATSEKQAK